MTQCWHITVSTDGRMPLFVDEAARRAAVRAVHRVFEGRLVLFCFADEHAHVVVLVTPGRIGRTRTSLVQVPRPLVAGPLAPPHARPIESRRHLSRLVPYILGQMEHHRLPAQPALWSGSCFQDLVEARYIGGARLRLWDLLPRERPEALLSHVGLPAGALGPAPDEVVRAAGATRLSQAAAAAVAAPPDLPGRSEAVCVARRAAARLADEVGLARARSRGRFASRRGRSGGSRPGLPARPGAGQRECGSRSRTGSRRPARSRRLCARRGPIVRPAAIDRPLGPAVRTDRPRNVR